MPVCVIWGIRAQQQTLNLTWLGVYSFKGLVQPEIHKTRSFVDQGSLEGHFNAYGFSPPKSRL